MGWIDKIKKQYQESRRKRMLRLAEFMFQVTEHDGVLWFTYNGCLFAPCHLLGCDTSVETVSLLKILRDMYIKRVFNRVS